MGAVAAPVGAVDAPERAPLGAMGGAHFGAAGVSVDGRRLLKWDMTQLGDLRHLVRLLLRTLIRVENGVSPADVHSLRLVDGGAPVAAACMHKLTVTWDHRCQLVFLVRSTWPRIIMVGVERVLVIPGWVLRDTSCTPNVRLQAQLWVPHVNITGSRSPF